MQLYTATKEIHYFVLACEIVLRGKISLQLISFLDLIQNKTGTGKTSLIRSIAFLL